MFGKKEAHNTGTPITGKLETDSRNLPMEIFLNDRRNEFLLFNSTFTVPKISVHGLTPQQKYELTAEFASIIPEFITGHSIMINPKPAVETLFIHYLRLLKGKSFDLLHVFKVDLKFAGDPDNIIEKGDNNFYPSYQSDRLYYKSFILPVSTVEYVDGSIQNFNAYKASDKLHHEAEQEGYFTYALFDDFSTEEMNALIYRSLSPLTFSISPKVYPLYQYAYFSAALSIPYPTTEELTRGIDFLEPAAIKILSDNGRLPETISLDPYASALSKNESSYDFTPEFIANTNSYLSRYSLSTNDELLLKNWRKLEIAR